MNSQWLKQPPAGALWVVDDSLTQMERHGIPIGTRRSDATIVLLEHAKRVVEDEALWRRAPHVIAGLEKEAFHRRLATALAACQGFN